MSEPQTSDPKTATLQFPLRGEWTALSTPARWVPSHGTNFLGQRYAYDFVRPSGKRFAPYGPSVWAHGYGVVPVTWFAAWGAPVHAAATGVVVAAMDGAKDRQWANALWDMVRLRWSHVHQVKISATDWRALAGNYLLIEGEEGFAFYAHLRIHSLRISVGDAVQAGEVIGEVGHSGRSSMPHLHFHLMDRAEGFSAQGIQCNFERYDRLENGEWIPTTAGIPKFRERIRVRSMDEKDLIRSGK